MNLKITKYSIITEKQFIIDSKIKLVNTDNNAFQIFAKEIYKHIGLNYPKYYKMDNLSKLGFLCAEALLQETKLKDKYNSDEIGIIIQNSNSSLDTDLEYQKTITDIDNFFPSPSVFVYTLPNILIGEISIKNKIQGEQLCLICENFDVELLLDSVFTLFNSNSIKCCIAGWVDFFQNKYNSFLCMIEQSDDENILSFNNENLYLLINN